MDEGIVGPEVFNEEQFEKEIARYDEELRRDIDNFYEEIERRCKEAKAPKVGCRREENTILLDFPRGRETYTLPLFGSALPEISALLSFEFENLRLLEKYLALFVCDGTDLEVSLTALTDETRSWIIREMRAREPESEARRLLPLESFSSSPSGATSITLGFPSTVMDIVVPHQQLQDEPSTMSLKVSGPVISRQDRAVTLLEGVANSFLFELDVKYGLSFSLERWSNSPSRLNTPTDPDKTIRFPRSKYDTDPLQLYFYAQSLSRLPLLQYLAYYQSIEYYFPIYSDMETLAAIKNMLKHPSFDMHDDSGIANLVRVAKGGTREYGDERLKIQATLQHCLTIDSLREFLMANQEREQYLAKEKELACAKIKLADTNDDLRAQAARRIYDIRCRIVHTKSSESSTTNPLLPFSKEASKLQHDMALIQFVAQRVIVAGARPLS